MRYAIEERTLLLIIVLEKDNAGFLKVPILTGQKPYFKRVLPLFSQP
jgi:hypothetical protein